MASSKRWTKEEEQFLIENYYNMTANEMSKHIDRTPPAIAMKGKLLGLNKNNLQDDDIRKIKQMRDDKFSAIEIADEFDCTKENVWRVLRRIKEGYYDDVLSKNSNYNIYSNGIMLKCNYKDHYGRRKTRTIKYPTERDPEKAKKRAINGLTNMMNYTDITFTDVEPL